MYIAQAFRAKHDFWRYLVGILIIVAAVIVGQLPLTVALLLTGETSLAEKMSMGQQKLMASLNSNELIFFMLLTFAIGLLGIFFVVKYIHQQSIRQLTTSRNKIDWKRFFVGFSLVAIFTIVSTAIDYYSNPSDYLVNFKPGPFLVLLLIAIVMIPLQTSFEEYLFRGYLMQGFGIMAKNKWLPLILTSVIFGGLHYFNPEVTKLGPLVMVYYIGTGFLLGIMTLMDEGMELSLGFHAGNNLIGVLLVTANWTAFQSESILKDISDPSTGVDVIIPIFIVYPIYLLIMARLYKWKNWKEKLTGKVVPLAVEQDSVEI